MSLHPSFIPQIHADESPASACSRVAVTLGRSARDFCLDMGISFAGIVEGRSDDLGKLASACRVGTAFPGLAITGSGLSFRIAGQAFTRDTLSRQRLRVCPCCVLEDVERGAGVPEARPYGRTIWQVASFRTCPVHRQPLVVVANEPSGRRMHDFALLVAPALERLRGECKDGPSRPLSSLENHLLARLSAAPQAGGWLSQFPAYAACRIAEIVGAVAEFGHRFKAEDVTEDEWHRAGDVGFGIADLGESGLVPLLDRLRSAYEQSRAPWGGRMVFGRLYEWLAYENDDPAYEPLRVLMRDYAVRTMPFGPGDTFLGAPVERRVVHSVKTLHVETGTHPKRLRKLLLAAGVLGEESAGRSDERATFPAAAVPKIADDVLETMSLAAAARYLNAPRPHDRILMEEGFVSPLVIGSEHGNVKHVIRRVDLDEFLARLLANAPVRDPKEQHLRSIPASTKRTKCRTAEILRLVLNNKLKTVRSDPEQHGYLSVLIDPAEVIPLVRREGHGALCLREVARLIGTDDAVVKALVSAGHLPSRQAINPLNCRLQTVVNSTDLNAFRMRYVSLMVLARERSRHFRRMSEELAAAGVDPVFDPEEVGARFFDRASCDLAMLGKRQGQIVS